MPRKPLLARQSPVTLQLLATTSDAQWPSHEKTVKRQNPTGMGMSMPVLTLRLRKMAQPSHQQPHRAGCGQQAPQGG